MQNQLTQIWQTYWLQFHCLIEWLFLVIIIIVLFNMSASKDTYSSRLAPALSIDDSAQSLTFDFRFGSPPAPPKPDESNLTHIPLLQPTIKSLSIQAYALSPPDVEHLRSPATLEKLSLIADDIPPGLLTAVATDLTELRINTDLLLDHGDELNQLTQLRLLIIDDHNLSPTLFALLSKIPDLHHLVIVDRESLGGRMLKYAPAVTTSVELSSETLHPLLSNSKATSIFANWPSDSTLPEQFPTRVFPIFAPSHTRDVAYFAAIPMLLAWVLIMDQTITLFSRPTSRLTPRFAPPHHFIAVSIFLVPLFLCMNALQLSGITLIAALTACLIPISVVFLFELPFGSITGTSRYFIAQTIYILFHTVLSDVLPVRVNGIIHHLLEGHLEHVALITALTQILFITACYLRTTRRLGYAPDPAPWFRWPSQTVSHHNVPTVFAPHQYIQGFWRQVMLWRAGNNSSNVFVTILILSVILMPSLTKNRFSFDWSFIIPQIPMLVTIAMLGTSSHWERRRKSFQTESLRPRTRRQFVEQIFAAIAFDVALNTLIPLLAFLVAFLIPASHHTAIQASYTIPLILMASCFIIAFNTSRLCWKHLFTHFLMIGIFITATTFATSMIPNSASPDTKFLIASLALLASLPLSGFILILTYLTTLSHEWGTPK